MARALPCGLTPPSIEEGSVADKILSIVSSAYRATLEEQDDTVVWLLHAMRGAGAELDVVLTSNAVNYAVRGQDASGLSFGDRRQTSPPRIGEDVAGLGVKGVRVFVVAEDLAARGIELRELVEGVTPLTRGGLAELCGSYRQVWHW
jgi:sulfur transfer complex TusBCD TusB component (DsrH family)